MALQRKSEYKRSMAPERFEKGTGKQLDHWFRLLTRFDVAQKGHKAAAAFLTEKHGVDGWWAQSLVVEYERAHGLREANQTTRGFESAVSRTVAATTEDAWGAWADAKKRSKWFGGAKHTHRFVEGGTYENAFGDRGEYRAIVPPKRLRFTWENEHAPGTVVEVTFTPKGEGTVVRVTHTKLKDAAAVAMMKEGWSWILDSLKSWLETGKALGHEEWLASKKKS